ncbi:MAG: DUF222 domain-containing protein, partial [Acidimicrobiia bacterium]
MLIASNSAADTLRGLLPDIGSLDANTASAALSTIKICRGFLDAYEAKLTRHIARLHADGESAPPTDLHTRDGGVSSKEAQQKERRSKALEHAPSLAERLEAGECTAAHADALADVTSRLDDDTRAAFFDHDELLAHDATQRTPEEFTKNCRDLIRSIERDQGLERDRRQRRDTRLTKTVDRDGMYVINGRFHPELGTAIFNALDAETAALVTAGGDRTVDRAGVTAQALGNLVIGGHQAIRPTEAEIRLHVTEHTLTDPDHHGVCEYDDGTPVPVPPVRRMICNGHIIPIITDTNGNVLNVGHTHNASPTGHNAEPCAPCTAPAPSTAARQYESRGVVGFAWRVPWWLSGAGLERGGPLRRCSATRTIRPTRPISRPTTTSSAASPAPIVPIASPAPTSSPVNSSPSANHFQITRTIRPYWVFAPGSRRRNTDFSFMLRRGRRSRAYLRHMEASDRRTTGSTVRLVLLASGNGSNLQAVLDACSDGRIPAQVAAVVSDRSDARALRRAADA